MGRTDFPGGNGRELKKSIESLATFPTELLLSGHGPLVEGKEAVKKNYDFIREAYFSIL